MQRESKHQLSHLTITMTTSNRQAPPAAGQDQERLNDALDLAHTRLVTQLVRSMPGLNKALADREHDQQEREIRYNETRIVLGVHLQVKVIVTSTCTKADLKEVLGNCVGYTIDGLA